MSPTVPRRSDKLCPRRSVTGAWSVVSDIPRFVGSLEALAQQLGTDPKVLFEAIWDEVKDKASTPNGQGALAFEIVTVLLSGGTIGGLKQSGKLAKLLNKFKKIEVPHIKVPKAGAQVSGGKLDYLFGNATGAKNAAHNAPRTAQNAAQMKRLGLYDDAVGRGYLQRHFDDVVNDPTNITRSYSNKFGNFETRESLFAGPSGQFVKFESTWEILADGTRRLITVIPFGGL